MYSIQIEAPKPRAARPLSLFSPSFPGVPRSPRRGHSPEAMAPLFAPRRRQLQAPGPRPPARQRSIVKSINQSGGRPTSAAGTPNAPEHPRPPPPSRPPLCLRLTPSHPLNSRARVTGVARPGGGADCLAERGFPAADARPSRPPTPKAGSGGWGVELRARPR
jgi:hypothetical protein